jgi:hypothetical protein
MASVTGACAERIADIFTDMKASHSFQSIGHRVTDPRSLIAPQDISR